MSPLEEILTKRVNTGIAVMIMILGLDSIYTGKPFVRVRLNPDTFDPFTYYEENKVKIHETLGISPGNEEYAFNAGFICHPEDRETITSIWRKRLTQELAAYEEHRRSHQRATR